MVARVPLFAGMDQSEVAEITKLLYTRSYLPGVPMVRTGEAARITPRRGRPFPS
jgi:voltage-gated potassium channel